MWTNRDKAVSEFFRAALALVNREQPDQSAEWRMERAWEIATVPLYRNCAGYPERWRLPLTRDETAAELGISPETVKRRERELRRGLRTACS